MPPPGLASLRGGGYVSSGHLDGRPGLAQGGSLASPNLQGVGRPDGRGSTRLLKEGGSRALGPRVRGCSAPPPSPGPCLVGGRAASSLNCCHSRRVGSRSVGKDVVDQSPPASATCHRAVSGIITHTRSALCERPRTPPAVCPSACPAGEEGRPEPPRQHREMSPAGLDVTQGPGRQTLLQRRGDTEAAAGARPQGAGPKCGLGPEGWGGQESKQVWTSVSSTFAKQRSPAFRSCLCARGGRCPAERLRHRHVASRFPPPRPRAPRAACCITSTGAGWHLRGLRPGERTRRPAAAATRPAGARVGPQALLPPEPAPRVVEGGSVSGAFPWPPEAGVYASIMWPRGVC